MPNATTASVASKLMMAMTTRSSIRVKPFFLRIGSFKDKRCCGNYSTMRFCLPTYPHLTRSTRELIQRKKNRGDESAYAHAEHNEHDRLDERNQGRNDVGDLTRIEGAQPSENF